MQKFDVIIIGGGAGAFAAAIRADELKARAALCAAHEMSSKNSKSLIVEYIYDRTRTYFIKNS